MTFAHEYSNLRKKNQKTTMLRSFSKLFKYQIYFVAVYNVTSNCLVSANNFDHTRFIFSDTDKFIIIKASQAARDVYSKVHRMNGIPDQKATSFSGMDNEYLEGPRYLTRFYPEKKMVVLSFRGTKSKVDVLHDFQIGQVILKGVASWGRVHKGFIKYYETVERDIRSLMVKSSMNLRQLVVTGHSLGGAVATIAAALLAHEFSSFRVTCITFGSPRVGDRPFREWYSTYVANSFRFVNANDIVVHAPHSHKYVHVCPALILNGHGLETQDKTVSRARLSGVLLGIKDIEDHWMNNYLSRILEMIS